MDNHLLREKYITSIEDVALEISQSDYWRTQFFESEYDQRILISEQNIENVPIYIKHIFTEEKLMFLVSKVKECPEVFDEGSIIFKFESVPFASITRFSGN
ncbi:hypothetical protein [Candidatus Enterococcus murrayae]|uniref:Uncharacterized protein n=1 Tax=Candidatus Enterococcus murrayae TaxID=2815321 RepID=A0ABS3HI86_9ENTE|nr:hypothetical protein [Enterococcus sp. MJM16]MBO0453175.1 hypothetical protein [Enterococcus sp. MJM16]